MCRSTGAMILADDGKDKSDEELAAKVYDLEMNYREQRKASLLAFRDWTIQHNFQMETEMLEASSIHFSILVDTEEKELRETENYQSFALIFQKAWDQMSISGNS